MEHTRTLGHHQKAKHIDHGHPRNKQTKDTYKEDPTYIINKIIEENFPDLKKDISILIQDTYRTPNTQVKKRNTSQHMIDHTQNKCIKEKILRAARQNEQVTFRGKPIEITTDFSIQMVKARRAWRDTVQVLNEHKCQTRLLYPAKLSVIIDGERKIFHDKSKLKDYMATKPGLQRILEEMWKMEEKDKHIQETKEKKQYQHKS